MDVYPGYGEWKYDAETLQRSIKDMARIIPILMNRHSLDGIVLHGSSGVWLGAAIVMHNILPAETAIVLVRKTGEQSHGEIVEGNNIKCTRLLMIDDFVSSGQSVRRVQSLIRGQKLAPATVEAVFCHRRVSESKSYDIHEYKIEAELVDGHSRQIPVY